MTTRKTIDRRNLLRNANAMLAHPNISEAQRLALRTLVERVLMDGNTYRGFQFLNEDGTVDLSPEPNTTNRVCFY